jgi:SAM-dependent methyltransferase
MSETKANFTVADIEAAILYAAEKNPAPHAAEVLFAKQIRTNPHLLKARVIRSRRVVRLLGPSKGVFADVGAGICLNSVLAIYNGVREMHAIEVDHHRYVSGQLIVEKLGLKDRVHIHTSDVLKLDLPKNSLDGGLSAEFLEHISDLRAFYKLFNNWLRPGGKFYARTGANGRGWEKKRSFPKVWEFLDKKYQPWREEIIRKVLPDAPTDVVQSIRDRTRGFVASEIETAAREYQKTGALPRDRRPCPPRDPHTGQYMERLMDPFETARDIDSVGFKTTVLAPDFTSLTEGNFFKRTAMRTVGEFIRATHPWSLFLSPWLELLSENQKTA